MGLDEIYSLTKAPNNYKLRIELKSFDFPNAVNWIEYDHFSVDSLSTQFKLNLGQADKESNIQDAMYFNKEMKFSTFDKNEGIDQNVTSCSEKRNKTGWWWPVDEFEQGELNCGHSNLNGVYHDAEFNGGYSGQLR